MSVVCVGQNVTTTSGEGWGWDPMLSPHLFSNRDSVTIELSCETGFAS